MIPIATKSGTRDALNYLIDRLKTVAQESGVARTSEQTLVELIYASSFVSMLAEGGFIVSPIAHLEEN